MFSRVLFSISFRSVLALLITIVVFGCSPVPAPKPFSAPVTPTPEIFISLNPSPTPAESTLPLTCQVTDLSVYINEEWGYCFAYPREFTIDESRTAEGITSLYGPALEDNTDPLRVSLEIATRVMPETGELAPLVDAFLIPFHEIPWEITREPWLLGSVDAEKLEPVPGLLSSRVVIALHEGILFTLRFHPLDITMAELDLNSLTQTVSGSFSFLPPTVQPSAKQQTVSWSEFGQNISVSYLPLLAPWVEARTVPAVPVSDQILFAESHPAYAQIRFLGFQGGRVYELPLLPFENRVAQVMIFQTADFSGFGGDSDNPQGFGNQLQALSALLQRDLDPARCAEALAGEPAMPFLPWLNAQQSFCAQPRIIEFSDGKGIRYLTHYAQGLNPVLDQHVFYTFQGLTEDGKFYVSALFPVETGIFPLDAPECPRCGEPGYDLFAELQTLLTEQLAELNAQAEDDFLPSINVLDDLIRSIHIGN
jgi:hypothetical protein